MLSIFLVNVCLESLLNLTISWKSRTGSFLIFGFLPRLLVGMWHISCKENTFIHIQNLSKNMIRTQKATTGEITSIVCVYLPISVWVLHKDFLVSVYLRNAQACTPEKYPVSLHLCLGRRLELQPCADCSNVGMNGSHHLLSLVSQMEKGCTVESEQSPVTKKRDIFIERRTEWVTKGKD